MHRGGHTLSDHGVRGWAEDRRLTRRHRGRDGRGRDALIRRYLPLARRLAARYRNGPEPFDDLVQVASLGLVKAADRWDPDRGLPFPSYAVPTILGELRRHFRDTTWVVRPPRDLQELCLTVEHARAALGAANGREPTVIDLAERLGRPPREVAEALEAAGGRWGQSLDAAVGDDEDGPSSPADRIGGNDGGYDAAEARATLERLTSILDERAREILRLRYEEDMVQSEIAVRVGCSQMQVSRILTSSLERLNGYGVGS